MHDMFTEKWNHGLKAMNTTSGGDKDAAPTPTPPGQRHTERRVLLSGWQLLRLTGHAALWVGMKINTAAVPV